MFPNKEEIKQILSREKKLLKTKECWILVALGILFVIGKTVPEYSLLQLPIEILFAGAIPGLFAIQCSIPFAVKFVRFHK